MEVTVNGNVYKNGTAVGIPGTGETGLNIAAALGAIKKRPESQLAVLAEITQAELAAARSMLKQEIVAVKVDEGKKSLSVRVRINAGNDWAEAVIADKHTNLVRLERNGYCLFSQEQAATAQNLDYRQYLRGNDLTIKELIEAIETMPFEELAFILEGVNMNVMAAQTGLSKRLGLGIGALYYDMVTDGRLSDDIVNYAKMLTAAAADARMSGESVPVMSSAGSGNHGITVILPVYAAARKLAATSELVARAVAISHVVTVYIKMHTGNLSALCGCAVAAATGASAAIVWLMGGTIIQIEWAMKNVIANLSGMICDGGKVGCALKLSTAAGAAVEGALLAQNNIVVPDTNGIIGTTIEQTIKNLGQISSPGMAFTDKVILDIMLAKS
ncbi:hypothetical protein SDC9_118619 [bioreactor metagenome]|uniref:Serine dehydratase-like alpha subunit domain-containing protein n=1 Tax=bioreactor metagenome TaxID=1076179 RepID=A0A645C3W9_9ZZZZ